MAVTPYDCITENMKTEQLNELLDFEGQVDAGLDPTTEQDGRFFIKLSSKPSNDAIIFALCAKYTAVGWADLAYSTTTNEISLAYPRFMRLPALI